MSMSVGSGGGDHDPEVMVEMNTTPLIDVMLVLLVMLIITIPIQFHSVNLNMPVGNPPPPTKPPVIVNIEVDFDGTVLWDGVVVPTPQALDRKLKVIGESPLEEQPEVHLRPNKLVAYKSVAAVLAAAQRLNVVKIGIISSEQFI